ncbi:MAG: hypothetical protein ACLUEQ_08010 [Cloacibacillus evryensis]
MLILHTAFEQDQIYLWGESSFENKKLRNRERAGGNMLPWSAKPQQLRAALRECGVRHGRRTPADESFTASLLIPARGKTPLPSSPILGGPRLRRTSGPLRLLCDAVALASQSSHNCCG